jgi:hypothetical protein
MHLGPQSTGIQESKEAAASEARLEAESSLFKATSVNRWRGQLARILESESQVLVDLSIHKNILLASARLSVSPHIFVNETDD